jgi:hypothetical protein
VYIPQTYELVYSLNGDSYEDKEVYIDELTSYFLFTDDLTSNWSETELAHYSEVKDLYVFGLFFIIISFFLVYSFRSIIDRKLYSKTSLMILGSHLLIFIDFNFFWDSIFHPFLFNNSNWIILPEEISYFLFPYSYFSTTLLLIFIFTVIIHIFMLFKHEIISLIRNE